MMLINASYNHCFGCRWYLSLFQFFSYRSIEHSSKVDPVVSEADHGFNAFHIEDLASLVLLLLCHMACDLLDF